MGIKAKLNKVQQNLIQKTLESKIKCPIREAPHLGLMCSVKVEEEGLGGERWTRHMPTPAACCRRDDLRRMHPRREHQIIFRYSSVGLSVNPSL